MSLLLLIRHGENDYTKKHKLAGYTPEVHLNERGQTQAQALADALKDVPIKAIYSSPLERAMETAAPIAAARKLEIQVEEGLLETNVGKWQGRSLAALRLQKAWKVVQSAPSRAQFPEGETFYECQTRIVTALDSISRKYKPQDIVACVFHADPIKLAVAHYIGLPLDHFQRLSCDTGSLTALYVGEAGANLIKLNQRPPFDFLLQNAKAKNNGKA
ncbi:MAG TPA: histidine phosphatase family protein [Anaerolineales bacterium]|jgi:probable phosphoglycerate mutase|nr:histidine phosphatase family protein [Anaerolineales bacterium]